MQTLTSSTGYTTVQKLPRHNQAFLRALKTIEFGRLTLITPEGERMAFTGASKGPLADWRLSDWGVLDEFMVRGEIGIADTYIDGRWSTSGLEELITFGLMNGGRLERFFHGQPWHVLMLRLKYLLQGNSMRGSRRNVVAHYDLGSNFYKLWLGKSMTYSCALFEGDESRSLEDAQQAKYERVLQRLGAQRGQHILEIGCGWGGFAEAAASKGVRVTALTLAPVQAACAREKLASAGLDHLVSVEVMDYREIKGQFDHVVSIGMFEHVGECHWAEYFDTIRSRLKPGGKAMIQTVMLGDRLYRDTGNITGVIEYYISPGAMLPCRMRFLDDVHDADLACTDMYTFGQDYVTTLTHWLKRFEANLDSVRAYGYDERFIRLWRFYLTSCIASFRSRRTSVMQAELMHA